MHATQPHGRRDSTPKRQADEAPRRTSEAASQGTEHLSDLMTSLQRMPQRAVKEHLVHVVAALPSPRDVASVDEVLHDAVHRTLADTNQPSDLGQPHLTILGDAHQHVRMVREERPRWNHRRRAWQLLDHPAMVAGDIDPRTMV